MQESKVADNPQATDDLGRKLAWLGGIIDADGSIMIRRACAKSKNPYKRIRYSPLVSIANTSLILIERCARILDEAHLPYYIRKRIWDKRPTKATKGRKRRKPLITLQIAGYRRLFRSLPILLPHIYAKHNQGQLLWWWLNYRKALNGFRIGGPRKGEQLKGIYTYGAVDEECYQRLKQMKQVIRSPREHTWGSYGDDVLRTLGRPREVAEMTARQLMLVN